MSTKQNLYNTVFSLLEEELYQRTHPETYNDKIFDNMSNNSMSEFDDNKCLSGGSNNNSFGKIDKYVPGKFDALRNSYNIPLNIAIKGTIERQKMFMQKK